MKTIKLPKACSHVTVDENVQRYTAPCEVQFLCWIAHQSPGNILEIGCCQGRTSRDIAQNNPDKTIIALDYYGEEMIMVNNQKREKPDRSNFGKYARGLSNIRLYNQKSQTINYSQEPFNTVGLIFIDGDHSYNGVKVDSEKAIQHCKRKGNGIIIWHDCYEACPAWCKVLMYLKAEIDPFYTVKRIENTWLAFTAFGLKCKNIVIEDRICSGGNQSQMC